MHRVSRTTATILALGAMLVVGAGAAGSAGASAHDGGGGSGHHGQDGSGHHGQDGSGHHGRDGRRAGNLAVGSALNQYPSPAGPGFSRLTVSARSGPSGEDPHGFVRAHGTTGAPNGEFAVSGPVTCLLISGNRASIKYRFTRATGSAAIFQGGGVQVFVEDNGHSRGGQPVDANAFDAPMKADTFNATATQCRDPNAAAYNKVESGHYTVRSRAVTAP